MSQFVPLKVKSITPQTDQAICIAFDVVPEQQEQFQFQPGQHLTIRHLTEAGEIRRCYSIVAMRVKKTSALRLKKLIRVNFQIGQMTI